jgi:GNAT superfamily N-acetyltransferase
METPRIELCDDADCQALDAFLVARIYEFNSAATGYRDAALLAGRLRDHGGDVIAAFNGHTWGACCVVAHLWVDAAHRGRGLGRALLRTAEAEAERRGCEQVVLSTHSFQAPLFYERMGYRRRATIPGWPKGHADVVYVKRLPATS